MIAVAQVMEDVLSPEMAILESPEAVKIGQDGEGECGEEAGGGAEVFAERLAGLLRERIGEERFDLWFGHKTAFTLAGNTVVVEAANDFVTKWIAGKFRADLLASAAAIVGREVELCVRTGQISRSAREAVAAETPEKGGEALPSTRQNWARGPAQHGAAASSPISAKFTLEEFVVGPSNQMAYQAAVQVTQRPGEQFNPLFIHGHCGLGKTHLLQGICQRFAKLYPGKRWLYLTGEQFTNEFLEALKTNKTDAFRRRIRQTDLLVIDDVHFLGNKKVTQEEFLHTFNQIDAGGRQIVLASDCAPRQIMSLSEQLSSRFVSGMVLRIDSPDLPTRLEILRRRAARSGWNVADALLMHVAQSSLNSVREMEGLLMQVVAGIRLIDGGHGTGAEAGEVLAGIRARTAMRGPVPVERIVPAVAQHFAVEAEAILGRGREKMVSAARAVAMYLARQHSGMSYPEIGRAFGNKNHSTVIAACQRVEGMITGGALLFWNTPAGPRQQAVSDILHEMEAAIRRVK